MEEQAPSSTSAVVSPTPVGPAAPAGGWHVAFADGFGAPLGTASGQDNFWYPNEGECCDASKDHAGNNGDELEVYNSSQVKVGQEGLELIDAYQPNTGGTGKNYVSGAAQTFKQYEPGGYHGFSWEPGKGETWAFECVCKLPSYFRGLDTGWWSTDWAWSNEVDFFESWTSGSPNASEAVLGTAWVYETDPRHTVESSSSLWQKFNPSAAFHRYTTVITPSDTIEEYIDGVHLFSFTPPYLAAEPKMGLVLSNALREETSGGSVDKQFTSGTRTWDIRSIAVYEDGDHAGQNVEGGGVAPGTTVG